MAGHYANYGNVKDLTCLFEKFEKTNVSSADTNKKFSSSARVPLSEINDCGGSVPGSEEKKVQLHQLYSKYPYYNCLPRGAAYPEDYMTICQNCQSLFNDEKWACTSCGWHGATIKMRACSLCNTRGEHSSWQCPKDTARAAIYKTGVDKMMMNTNENVHFNRDPFEIPKVPTPFPEGYRVIYIRF